MGRMRVEAAGGSRHHHFRDGPRQGACISLAAAVAAAGCGPGRSLEAPEPVNRPRSVARLMGALSDLGYGEDAR